MKNIMRAVRSAGDDVGAGVGVGGGADEEPLGVRVGVHGCLSVALWMLHFQRLPIATNVKR